MMRSGWSPQYPLGFTAALYPCMTLLPSGKVFYSGADITTRSFNPANQTWTTMGNRAGNGTRLYGSSVLLALTPATITTPESCRSGGGFNPKATTEMIAWERAVRNEAFGRDSSRGFEK